jgi:superfamily II DNA/RNA helicase/HKD family nuclease
MTLQLTELRNAYHKILHFEYSKYEKMKKLQYVYFTLPELQNEVNLSEEIIKELHNRGFIVSLGGGKFRSLLMDIAFRISDIRIKHGGTKYVLESKMTLKSRPFLKWDYVKFDKKDGNLNDLKMYFQKIIPEDLINRFLEALNLAGIEGLSIYQFRGILDVIQNERDVIISAPTAFGKTYIFIIPVLLTALRAKIEEKKSTIAVIFYPRKSLESDQMGRLIKLIYYVNRKCGVHLSIGIDDGNVKKRRDIKEFEEFRGIKCPIHSEETLIIKQGKVFCRRCNSFFDFIRLTREDFVNKPPTILITNIWAYQYKFSDPRYWRNGYLSSDIKFFIFDEIHAYRSIVAGVLRYFIQILRTLVSSKARLILSSATIPKLEEFIQDIAAKDIGQFLKIVYDERIYGKDAEKIELYLLLGINPLTSWETYTHELAIFLSAVNRIRKLNNLQSLVFVDSIRNISRLYTQALEAIELGDPRDHLLPHIPPEDPFCYWVYNEQYKLTQASMNKINELREEIKNNLETHYSDKSDRFEIEKRIKAGNIDVVFATSTLELGVDYDKVSVIVNTGIPFALESIIQRVGRAGRNEDNTLYTSLCVIIVRNNPLEYFYLFKDIEELVEVDKLPKIPISISNLFVIFYSMLIYSIAYLTKKGESLLRREEPIKTLETLTKSISELKNKISKDLDIKLDTSQMEVILKEITELLKEPDINKKLERIRIYRERIWLISEFRNIISELNQVIYKMKEKINQLSKRERPFFMEKIEYIEDNLVRWKENFDLNLIMSTLPDVIQSLDVLKNYIRSDIHPLYVFKNELIEYSYKLSKYELDISKVTKIGEPFDIKDEKFTTYFRAEEVSKKLSENPISIAEAIIGFKFMGNEFIDQSVIVGGEFQLPTEKREVFLNNIISRMPPFELITIPFESKEQRDITRIVGARHFWLIKPMKGFYAEPFKIYDEIRTNYLGKGKVEKFKDMIIPQEINFIDLLALEIPLTIKMIAKDDKPLFIKYGSKKIAETKIDGKYSFHSNIKKLYSPSESYFEVIKERTLKMMKKLHEGIQERGNKWGLNFRYPSLCFLGRCISVDPFDNECPVHERCRLPGCDGKKYWSATKHKRKIFPKFHLSLEIRNLPKIAEPLFSRLQTITYDELKEDIEFMYDSVLVYLPRLFTDYLLRKIEITPIGYLARTSLIYLNFNNTLIELFIHSILEDPSLLELLKFKYFMFQQFKGLASSLDAAMKYREYNSSQVDTRTEEFYKFVKECLIHTLAHLLFLFLITKKVQVDPERITYFIDDSTIYILENSKSDGMGFVETIRNEIKEKGEKTLMEEFINWSLDFLLKHEEYTKKYQDLLQEESKNSLGKLKSIQILGEKLTKLQEKIKELNKNINSYVSLDYVDIITYRHILSQELIGWEEYEDELSEYLLPLIYNEGTPKLCVDGCDDCLIFYRGCSQPFIQNYITSKLLVLKFLMTMKKGHLLILGRNLGKSIEKIMEKSRKIMIKVPFIDEYGYSLLIKLKNEGREIYIITKEDNPYISGLLNNKVKVRTTSHFHTKLYYFETENEKICIHGSINLTYSGFYVNKENMDVIWEPSEVKRIEKELRGRK